MNHRKFPILTLILTAGVLAASASAETPSDARNAQVDAREARQQQRIDRGVQSGRVNPQEEARLQQRESALAARQARFNADGKLSRREQLALNRQANRDSRAISRKKRNLR